MALSATAAMKRTQKMDPSHFKGSPLSYLEGRDLSAVTFVRDYLQCNFDWPYINPYVWPTVITGSKIFDMKAQR